MNIRSLANSVVQRVNPNITAVALKNIGSNTSDDGSRVPLWLVSTVDIQVQGISSKELQFMVSQGFSGTLRQVFAPGYWHAAHKATHSGGDMFRFPEYPSSPARDWKVVLIKGIYEGWTKALVQMQSALVNPVRVVETDEAGVPLTDEAGQYLETGVA